MKKNLIVMLLGMLFAVASCSFTNKSLDTVNDGDKDKLLIEIIAYMLEKGHYEPKDINDDFSVSVFEEFIDVLDPTKRYFLESDIKEFEKYKFQIDDQIKNTDISFFDLVHKRLMKRMDEASDIYKDILSKPFNFDTAEKIDINYEDQTFVSSKKELRERWRKQLKYATISTFDDKLTDKEKPLSKTEAEKAARELTKSTLDDFFDFVNNEYDREDWFGQYINTIVEGFDPHTYYFAPEDKDKFDVSMSGKFEGIGARLQKKKDQIKIVEVISGGPIWRDQTIEVGDEIIKVGQKPDEEPVDVTGMQLNDAIKLMKGPKGTNVYLTVKKVDGSTQVVKITRDLVEMEESYAKSATVKKEDHTYGIINLPKFYVDFKDYSNRNAASDVAKEIERLKQAGMEGLVLDLRDNGGGSLRTVVEMAGLFIKDGPVVQVKSSGSTEEKVVHEDKDERIQWDGPLVLLVNELSASASEILAAAMQDYKRGVVIGSKQTFGKGTVQNLWSLSDIVRNNEHGDLGALKVTTQKFYRINGGSTQLEGVKSDVVVPDKYSYIDLGERDQQNPLAWDKISPANYKTWDGYIDYKQTIANSAKRMAANSQLKLIEENAKWLKEQQDENVVSLSYSDYKKEKEKLLEKSKHFKGIYDYKTGLTFESLKYEKDLFVKDTILKEKRERWHKDLARDVYVEEAISVLKDLKINNIKNNNKLAAIKG
ncbi:MULTISPECIES: carboxy terminal-processing peptidase [Cellulophaga]|uniref:Carboxyl-terminal protease n=2 Tax=Cellulophaga TaxID=104264 RepID=F0RCD8_CELLC|nr:MULTISPECIES: carboxy terminal-processing peptidase [Cellulophaga]ADY28615.1 carboxyl-terminal protease [Cellulophaga lytica DSM 7489]AIM59668.1 peptidase S41 [Cellulophaga lytica]APU09527.1 tail-specific protease [Cellulophaga lytica]EWH12896.1 carboxyl-terminal protease [Cellulophaga geojensis KL-A]MDO6853918.1 carboxy terminal-processing peptidase [Cellulophaga lytica]